MHHSAQALGYDFVRTPAGKGHCVTIPASLHPDWSLKWCQPLQSPSACGPDYLRCLFIGCLTNSRPFTTSWASKLLAAAVWMHIAILSKFPMPVVLKSMIVALNRSYYIAPINMSSTILWARFIAPKLPLNRNAVNRLLVGWLREFAYWSGLGYASCHIPHTGPHSALCGDWNTDIAALHVLVEPQERSGWGSVSVDVHPPLELVCRNPAVGNLVAPPI